MNICLLQVMRSACAGIGSSNSGVATGSTGSREMHYVMRVLGPAACRSPNSFSANLRSSVEIALPPSGKITRGTFFFLNRSCFVTDVFFCVEKSLDVKFMS
jgi:E3 ubiquitin-protein ligase HUWE1